MRFVLVTGCPRSGTTAVGSWLITQSGATGVMESRRTVVMHAMLREAQRFWCFDPKSPLQHGKRATSPETLRAAARAAALRMYGADESDTRVLIDKEPLEPVALPLEDYGEYLATVRSVLDARLVFMVREPVATIASMLRRKWGYSLRDSRLDDLALDRCISIWRKNAALAVGFLGDRTVRVQRHEQLLIAPVQASVAITQFAHVVLATTFTPNATAPLDLTPEVVERIREETKPESKTLGY